MQGPSVEDLFVGPAPIDRRLAAAAVYRYDRVRQALCAAVSKDLTNDTIRRRFRIGLYNEFVSHFYHFLALRHPLQCVIQMLMRRAIADLMLSGCHGGPFFAMLTYPWLDKHSIEDQFIINWAKIAPPPTAIPISEWMVAAIDHSLFHENYWWRYSNRHPPANVTCPPWWNCDEASVSVSFLFSVARHV